MGRPRHWILEIHFIDRRQQFGGFFEELLTLDTHSNADTQGSAMEGENAATAAPLA
jgi:hypothetical protein